MAYSGFSVVVAMDRNRGIGNKGDLPWPRLRGDMKFFRELTSCPDRAAVEKRWGLKPEESADVQKWEDVNSMLRFAHPLPVSQIDSRNAVVMGRKTWDSLPSNFKPLPGRTNIVLSRRGFDEEVAQARSIKESFRDSRFVPVFLIGGGEVYSDAVKDPDCSCLYVTEVDAAFECDTCFPETPDFRPVLSSPWIDENGIRYRFRRYDRA